MGFVRDAAARARVLVRGTDGPAFLHRLSTQHVNSLQPGEARLNVLTTDKGRIKDVVHHAVVDADTILLVGHRLTSDELIAWLDRYCFSEAVTFEALVGPCVLVDAVAASATVPAAATLGPFAMARHGDVIALRSFDRVDDAGQPVPTCLLVGLQATATLPALHLDDDTANSGRRAAATDLAAGIPVVEMSEAHTPLDLELHDAIHWAKGCYIGQEVIARLDTYGKQRKRLVAIESTALIEPGDEVIAAGVVVGAVTSSVPEPLTATCPRALALVKLEAEALPCDVEVRGARGSHPARAHSRRAAQVPHD
jgi:tRNA-modifying protein YgfZ